MIILVDTSVWIEYFNRHPSFPMESLLLLMEQWQVATCYPVEAEILSGTMSPPVRTIVKEAFQSMIRMEADWNSPQTWQKVSHFACEARAKKLPIPGFVDRMILTCLETEKASLWTLDQKLKQLTKTLGFAVFDG